MAKLRIDPRKFKVQCPLNNEGVNAHECRGYGTRQWGRCPYFQGVEIKNDADHRPMLWVICEYESADGEFWGRHCGDCQFFPDAESTWTPENIDDEGDCSVVKARRKRGAIACPFWEPVYEGG